MRIGLRAFVAALWIGYAIALLVLIDSRPLWLDEVIQLEGTCGGKPLIQHVLDNPGGAPLGYLGQHWLISLAGCSIRTARFLSIAAGVDSILPLILIGKRLGLSRATIFAGACLWAICPLAVRYSLEGRPYMQALLFALCAVAAQLQLQKAGKIRWAGVLAVCLAAAVYSQPFAVFAPLGFSLWNTWQSRNLRYAALTGTAYALAGLSFIPWLLTAYAYWRGALAQIQGGFEWTPGLALVLLRECVGDGYATAVPALVLAAAGMVGMAKTPFRDRRLPLLAAVLAGVLLAIAADARSGYFFAIRQVIYMAPFLLLLAAEGVTILWRRPRYRAPAVVLLGVFAAGAIVKNYGYLTDRNEDWSRLSARLSEVGRGGCILIPAGEVIAVYGVFHPELAQRACDASLSSWRIVIPWHRYSDPAAVRFAEESVLAKGMTRVSTEQVGFARIDAFAKPEGSARSSP